MPETSSNHWTGKAARIRSALDIVGDKWTIMIVFALLSGPKRPGALKRELEPITQKVLTHALRRLEAAGLVQRTVVASVPARVDYALTPLGVSLEQPLLALCTWVSDHEQDLATE